jgi:serine/threonine-protein kinase RsbW
MAIEEAAKNAMVHGNKLNESKKVTISFQRKNSGLVFQVEDQGEGFDYSHVPDLMKVSDTEYPNTGKGIYLMRSLADKIEFGTKGKKVSILFDISSINRETTLNRIHNLQKYFKKQKTTA